MSWKDRAQPVANGWKSRATVVNSAPSSVDEAADVSFGDRAIAKNFATTPDAQAAFIKKQYPKADVRVVDGEVEIKMPADKAFKRLDPSFSPIDNPMQTLKDLPSDISDIGYDAIAGLAQGAATIGGGILGAVGGPAGVAAGAVGASAASGGGLEAARQGLGQLAGIPQDMDLGQIGVSTAAGAVSPLLFGAGRVAPSAIARMAAAKGITNEAAEQALTQGTRGLVERSYDGVSRGLMPKIMGAATGVSADSIRYYGDNPALMANLKDTGITGELEKLSDTVTKYGKGKQTQLGKRISDKFEASGAKVDIAGAKKAFQDRISFLSLKSNRTNAEEAELNSLKGSYEKYFGLAHEIKPDINEINKSPELQRLFSRLDEAKDLKLPTPQDPARLADPVMSGQTNNQAAFNLGGFNIGDEAAMNKGIAENATKLQVEADRLAQLLTSKQTQLAKTTNKEQIKSILAEIKTTQDQLVELNTQRYLSDQIPANRAFDLQKKLKQEAAFEQGMTPETLSAKGSARDAYGALNDSFRQSLEGIQGAKDDYAQMLDVNDLILPKFKDAQTSYNTVIGMDKNGRQVLKEKLKDLEKKGALDIAEEAKRIKAFSEFYGAESNKKAPLAAIAGTIGSLLGYNTGGGYAAAAMGGIGGTAAGATLGSRPMLEAAIKKGISLEQLGRMAQPGIGYGAIASPAAAQSVIPWMLMPTPNE